MCECDISYIEQSERYRCDEREWWLRADLRTVEGDLRLTYIDSSGETRLPGVSSANKLKNSYAVELGR